MTITTDDVNAIVKAQPNIASYAEAQGVRFFNAIHAVNDKVSNGLEYNRAGSLLWRSTSFMAVVFWRFKMLPSYLEGQTTWQTLSLLRIL
ncbi:hypothetical protein DVH05_009196 [Phytophthora capsici]|nr:hypothetical protein DVH05_009196 [Phytophthora capsici]